jgi:hypothetical protein
MPPGHGEGGGGKGHPPQGRDVEIGRSRFLKSTEIQNGSNKNKDAAGQQLPLQQAELIKLAMEQAKLVFKSCPFSALYAFWP